MLAPCSRLTRQNCTKKKGKKEKKRKKQRSAELVRKNILQIYHLTITEAIARINRTEYFSCIQMWKLLWKPKNKQKVEMTYSA